MYPSTNPSIIACSLLQHVWMQFNSIVTTGDLLVRDDKTLNIK
jgi:hypothetical protein